MCNPIIDDAVIYDYELEPFKKEIVQEYLKNKEKFDKYPLRHYSQLELSFDNNSVKRLLHKLDIPVSDTKVTIFGGYTSQFASCLRSIGMQIVFTDPLVEWVEKAISNGFEAYKYAAEEIPKDLIERTNLFATFECYSPFVDSRKSIYTTLRFLTSKYGILFAESKRTTEEIIKEVGPKGMLKFSFLPYEKVYAIKRLFRGKGELRFYHFCASEKARQSIGSDCKIIKIIYDNLPNEAHLDRKTVATLAHKIRLSQEEVSYSLQRILNLYQLEIPRGLRIYLPNNMLQIFSKTFYVHW